MSYSKTKEYAHQYELSKRIGRRLWTIKYQGRTPTVHDLRFILAEESEKKMMRQQWLQDLAEALLIGVSIGAAIAIAYWTAAAFQGMIERMSIL